jgi:peptide/nickel transport system permease protein
MLRYTIKRLLWFIPTLVAVTIIGFMLLSSAPGNPVNSMVSVSNSGGSLRSSNDIEIQKNYWRRQLGLDLPLFYFSMHKL